MRAKQVMMFFANSWLVPRTNGAKPGYQCVTNTIALDERNPSRHAMTAPERDLADAVAAMDFSRPDRVDDDKLNRLNWISSGRKEPYPAAFAGPHGRGLAALGLKLEHTRDRDGDDDGD
jgi:hypothetical protein